MSKTPAAEGFSLAIEYCREEDGRCLADIPALPGVTAYGRTRQQATAAVQALALHLIATAWSTVKSPRLHRGRDSLTPMGVKITSRGLAGAAVP